MVRHQDEAASEPIISRRAVEQEPGETIRVSFGCRAPDDGRPHKWSEDTKCCRQDPARRDGVGGGDGVVVRRGSRVRARGLHRRTLLAVSAPCYFSPPAKMVWKCGGCSSRATTLTSIFLKPAASSQSCRSLSAKPSQRSPYSSCALLEIVLQQIQHHDLPAGPQNLVALSNGLRRVRRRDATPG